MRLSCVELLLENLITQSTLEVCSWQLGNCSFTELRPNSAPTTTSAMPLAGRPSRAKLRSLNNERQSQWADFQVHLVIPVNSRFRGDSSKKGLKGPTPCSESHLQLSPRKVIQTSSLTFGFQKSKWLSLNVCPTISYLWNIEEFPLKLYKILSSSAKIR